LKNMTVRCEITWIFKRYRKNLISSHGKLDVTIKRSMVPTQTCTWWKHLTPAEQTAVQNNLEYNETWNNLLSIRLICSKNKSVTENNTYSLQFLQHIRKVFNIVHAPVWATWGEDRANWVSFNLPEDLSLQCWVRTSEETDMIFLDTKRVIWPDDYIH
jgi:hypothetical protein